MKQTMLENLGTGDRIARTVVGTGLILAVLQSSAVAPWMAIVGAFLILTAMLARDPVYAAVAGMFGSASTERLGSGSNRLAHTPSR